MRLFIASPIFLTFFFKLFSSLFWLSLLALTGFTMCFHAFTMCFLALFCSRKLSIVATFSSHVEVLFSVSDVDVGVFVVCDTVGVLPLLQVIDNVNSYESVVITAQKLLTNR